MLPIFSRFKTLVMQSHAFPFSLREKDMFCYRHTYLHTHEDEDNTL